MEARAFLDCLHLWIAPLHQPFTLWKVTQSCGWISMRPSRAFRDNQMQIVKWHFKRRCMADSCIRVITGRGAHSKKCVHYWLQFSTLKLILLLRNYYSFVEILNSDNQLWVQCE
jgi:hypothetical protein